MTTVFEYFYPVQDPSCAGPTRPLGMHHSYSDAIDISTNKRDGVIPVYAIADGIVESSHWSETRNDFNGTDPNIPDAGNHIAIKITSPCALQGAYVTYMHLYPNANQVRNGTKVFKGQMLGYIGNTGHSTGPHLHIQIRSGSWGGKYAKTIPYSKVEIEGVTLRAQNPRGATDYLFRCAPVKIKQASQDDVRIACTMAILEAEVLGLIGMEETIAVAYNRLKHWKGLNTMYDVVSQKNQFSTYSANKALFNSGGYTQNQIPVELWNFTLKLLNGEISLTSSEGWATGYNEKIAKAFFFNSNGPYLRGQLFATTNGVFCHWYGDETCGGITK